MALNLLITLALWHYGTEPAWHHDTMALESDLDSAKVVSRSMALWHSDLLGTMAFKSDLDSAKVSAG